jgi:hypothetical protein
MKILKIVFLLMFFINFNSFSQKHITLYYDRFILLDKESNSIIEDLEIQTTLHYNTDTKILSITSPILVEKFYINDVYKDAKYVYLNIESLDEIFDILIILNVDGSRFVIYDIDKSYYYVFIVE